MNTMAGISINHFDLHSDRSPYDGGIAKTTMSPRKACEWRSGRVTAVAADGREYATRAMIFDPPNGGLSRRGLTLIDESGNDLQDVTW